MKCVIAEKPSVAKDIARVLGANQRNEGYLEGNNYVVTWAFGHLIQLAGPEEYGFTAYDPGQLPMMPPSFKYSIRKEKKGKGWVVDAGVEKQLKIIESCFNRSDGIIVATDAGREGELIFRLIYNFLHCTKPFQRLWISSLTDKAIKKGFDNLADGREYDRMYRSGRMRSEADWLVGMNASRALSISQKGVFSLGRVQTPTLRLICERYLENTNFKKIPFWKLNLSLIHNGVQYNAVCEDRFLKEDEAKSALDSLLGFRDAVVQSKTTGTVNTEPPLLYDLTALQKDANVQLNLSAEETLSVAQKLYESKLITYPRTGSRYISEDVFEEIPRLLDFLSGTGKYGVYTKTVNRRDLNRHSVDGSKVTDHHALLPTGESFDKLTGIEQKVYDLIVMRMLESFAPKSIKETMSLVFAVGDREFKLRLFRYFSLGWVGIRGTSNESSQEEPDNAGILLKDFPNFFEGLKHPIDRLFLTDHTTKPNPIYTDATVLSAMEHAGKFIEDKELKKQISDVGIGTPATRANIIETLIRREYVRREKKKLIPSDKGLFVYDLVKDKKISDVSMTAEWERALSEVEAGNNMGERFEEAIKEYTNNITKELLNQEKTFMEETNKKDLVTCECPECGEEMRLYEKLAKCTNEDCGFKVWRTVAQKKLTDNQLLTLIQDGELKQVKGFTSKAGKHFSAGLKIEGDGKVSFVFEDKKKD